VQVEDVLAGRVLTDDGDVDVRGALWLAGRPRGVVHHRVVLGISRDGLELVRLAADDLVPEDDAVLRFGLLAAGDEDDLLELRQIVPNLLDARPELRRRDKHLRAAVDEAVLDGVRAES